ncbi:hypothetical protein VDG1235_4611 [Verrucomicrobiia bacterium DG1235]|nr:hypothetical protein VDG1235_4611 [Verrucomicrobiae bacterium DG1235]
MFEDVLTEKRIGSVFSKERTPCRFIEKVELVSLGCSPAFPTLLTGSDDNLHFL